MLSRQDHWTWKQTIWLTFSWVDDLVHILAKSHFFSPPQTELLSKPDPIVSLTNVFWHGKQLPGDFQSFISHFARRATYLFTHCTYFVHTQIYVCNCVCRYKVRTVHLISGTLVRTLTSWYHNLQRLSAENLILTLKPNLQVSGIHSNSITCQGLV